MAKPNVTNAERQRRYRKNLRLKKLQTLLKEQEKLNSRIQRLINTQKE